MENEEKKETSSVIGAWILIIIAAIVLWCTNPSESKHLRQIDDVQTEIVNDGNRELRARGNYSNYYYKTNWKDLKYHSIGICSWTTVRYRGHTRVLSIGALGMVFDFIE